MLYLKTLNKMYCVLILLFIFFLNIDFIAVLMIVFGLIVLKSDVLFILQRNLFQFNNLYYILGLNEFGK